MGVVGPISCTISRELWTDSISQFGQELTSGLARFRSRFCGHAPRRPSRSVLIGGPDLGFTFGAPSRSMPAAFGLGLWIGECMKLKLTSEDRDAIDLLLDRAASAPAALPQAQGQSPPHRYAPAAAPAQVEAVRKVLGTLQVLPVVDPPVDLVSRTLARIGAQPNSASVHSALPEAHHSAHQLPTSH